MQVVVLVVEVDVITMLLLVALVVQDLEQLVLLQHLDAQYLVFRFFLENKVIMVELVV
mgnify:CR=1 FL=1